MGRAQWAEARATDGCFLVREIECRDQSFDASLSLQSKLDRYIVSNYSRRMKRQITYGKGIDVTPQGQDGYKYQFPFTIIDVDSIGAADEKIKTEHHAASIEISRSRLSAWRLNETELEKVLFEVVRRNIREGVSSCAIQAKIETIMLPMITTLTHGVECPYDPIKVPDIGERIEIVDVEKRMGFH